MLKILQMAATGKSDDGGNIPLKARECLAEAALDIIFTSMVGKGKEDSKSVQAILKPIDINCPILYPHVLENYTKGPDWAKRMLNSIVMIQNAAIDIDNHCGSCPAIGILQQVRFKVIGLFKIMLQYICDDSDYASSAVMLPHVMLYREHYSVYGCINARNLALAQVQRSLIREEVPESSQDVTRIVSALEKLRSDDLRVADILISEALRKIDEADEIALKARNTTELSVLFTAVHECCLLYERSKLALDWGIERYERAGKEVPDDILKERQVIEEYRADTNSFLHSTGGKFIFGPIIAFIHDHAIRKINSLDDSNISLEKMIIDSARNYAGRTPLYPETLLNAWSQIAAKVDYQNGNSPIDQLNDLIKGQLTTCFQYDPVVTALHNIYAKWNINWSTN